MVFENGVRNIQAAAFNGARTVYDGGMIVIVLTKSNHQFRNFHEFLNQFFVVFFVTAVLYMMEA